MFTVTEVVRLVNHHQVIIAPIDKTQINSIRGATLTTKIRMIKNIVIQAVISQGIILIIALKSIPVITQTLRTKNKNSLVSGFKIFNNTQRRKRFTKTHRIGKYTSTITIKFCNTSNYGVPLEIVKHIPNLRLLEANSFIRKRGVIDVFKEFTKNIIKRNKINKLWRIFFVSCRNIFKHGISYVSQAIFITPHFIESVNVLFCQRSMNFDYRRICVITSIFTQFGGSEVCKRTISSISLRTFYIHKWRHHFIRNI